jgi:hypothetical protein
MEKMKACPYFLQIKDCPWFEKMVNCPVLTQQCSFFKKATDCPFVARVSFAISFVAMRLVGTSTERERGEKVGKRQLETKREIEREK